MPSSGTEVFFSTLSFTTQNQKANYHGGKKSDNACNRYFHWFKYLFFFLYKQNLNHGTPFDYLSANAFFLKNV